MYLCDNGLSDLMKQISFSETNSHFPRQVSPSLCWICRFITAFTRARHLSLSCCGWIHSTSSYPKICFNSIIRGTSKIPKWFFFFHVFLRFSVCISDASVCHVCCIHTRFTHLELITQIVAYLVKLWNFSRRSILHPPVNSSLWNPNFAVTSLSFLELSHFMFCL
jgi:hypothetical protein